MLGVLLTILKIILWVILAVIGLVLLLVLLVLFAPIRYSMDLDYHETALVCAKVRFLIVKVKVLYNQATKQMEQVIRVAGIRVGNRKHEDGDEASDEKPDKKKRKKKADGADKSPAEETVTASLDKPVDGAVISTGTPTDGTVENSDTPTDGTATDTDKPVEETLTGTDTPVGTGNLAESQDGDDADDYEFIDPLYDLWDEELQEELPEKEKKLLGRLSTLIKKLIGFLQNLSPDKISEKLQTKKSEVEKKVTRIKKFWNLSCTVKTRAYLKKYLLSVFKHIAPRKARGHIRYGFDEPYKTGQITGYLSLMPFVYQKHLSFEPDFYNKIIEAELVLKGKVRIGYLLRIVLNINIWRTLKAFRRLTKKA